MTSLAEKMVSEGLTLDELKPEDEEIRIHLVTYNNEEFYQEKRLCKEFEVTVVRW